jgi:AraC-like DNA-binding protein
MLRSSRLYGSAWRQRARLVRALEMLAAGEPLGTVALDLGYSTASAFIAVFREAFGCTPAFTSVACWHGTL